MLRFENTSPNKPELGASRRLRRLVQMIWLLDGARVWNVRELLAKFNVSRRTLFRDLKTIREAGIPLVTYKGRYRIQRLPIH